MQKKHQKSKRKIIFSAFHFVSNGLCRDVEWFYGFECGAKLIESQPYFRVIEIQRSPMCRCRLNFVKMLLHKSKIPSYCIHKCTSSRFPLIFLLPLIISSSLQLKRFIDEGTTTEANECLQKAKQVAVWNSGVFQSFTRRSLIHCFDNSTTFVSAILLHANLNWNPMRLRQSSQTLWVAWDAILRLSAVWVNEKFRRNFIVSWILSYSEHRQTNKTLNNPSAPPKTSKTR